MGSTGTFGRQEISILLDEAISHHRAGRLDEAETRYRRILTHAPSDPNAHNLLCALYLQLGELERAIDHGADAVKADGKPALYWNNYGAALRRAGRLSEAVEAFRASIARDPSHPDARVNLAGTLADQGSLADAVAEFRRVLKREPRLVNARISLGHVLYMSGDTEAAIATWKVATETAPENGDGWTNLVGVYFDTGRYDAAAAAFSRAEQVCAPGPDLLANRARVGIGLGEADAAEQYARRGLMLDGAHIGCATVLATVRLEQGDMEGAEALSRQVTARAPGHPEAWSVLAAALNGLRRYDEAAVANESILEAFPDNVDALARLADIHEKRNKLDRAWDTVSRALEVEPGHPFANRVAATILRRRGDTAAALARLQAIEAVPAPPTVRQGIQFELGQLHDRLGQAPEAFSHFLEANRLQSESPAARRHDPAIYREEIGRVHAILSAEWISGWRDGGKSEADAPVFLVGFPRSGTTLLDQILDSHPAIQVAEEKPMMEELKRELSSRPGGYPGALADLGPSELAALRNQYWAVARRYADSRENSLLVDKLPLNLEKAVLIHRVFPNARFILALRHPADCVLSCFMQSFRPNISMNNFYNVEDAARLYEMVFGLWEEARKLLPLDVHEIRYEDLVAEFRPEVARLLDYLGLPWDDAVESYRENAQRRGRINTPSYNQVTEPIYTRASGRWTRYEDQMSGALTRLAPWIERYGY